MRSRLPVEGGQIYQQPSRARGRVSRAGRTGALALALAALAAACEAPGGVVPEVVPDGGSAARVVRVVDGDTLIARIGGDEVRVRLLGVDAPESVTPERPVECYGPEAAAAARGLLREGDTVSVAIDPSQGREDRFGRLLGEVTRPGDARTVNERLVALGAAEVFRGDGTARLLPRLRTAEGAAREAGRGLWGACRGR